ncbi:hypothetical protein TH2_18981 [Thalassospira profundimaris WP0211]|nr:hypothetical protein TH2_18981 [Thalassospira profundimaris WP0211]
MHIPGVMETKKAVGMKAPINDKLSIMVPVAWMALRPDRHYWGRDVIRDEITTRLVKFRPVSFWYGRNDISVAV